MAAKEWCTIRVPRPVFERQNRRRKAAGRTWAAHLDAVAPDPPTLEDVVRQAAREAAEAELAESDLVEDEPEPEPLEPLAVGTYCHVCSEDVGDRSGTCAHLLKEHAAEVNAFMAELRARQNGNGTKPERDREDSDEPLRVNQDGPVSYFDAPTKRQAGQAWGNGHLANVRECDIDGPDCYGRMSKNYARVFAREEDGRLACPNCLSRSGRYSADHAERGDGRTNPANLTGQANPAAAVPHGADED